MILNYDTNVAVEVGANAATVFYSICFWVYQNQKNNTNYRDGKYWVYNTQKAWATYYEHLTERQVCFCIGKLEEAGLIESACYNNDQFDRTKWYTVTAKGAKHFCAIDSTNLSNDAREYCIINSTDNISINTRMRMNKPLNAQEVVEEVGKRRLLINENQAQDFINKHEAVSDNGVWVIGKNVVTDWRLLITNGWIKGWQEDYRRSRDIKVTPPDDVQGRPTLDELQQQIENERRERGDL